MCSDLKGFKRKCLPSVERENNHFDKQKSVSDSYAQGVHEEHKVLFFKVHDRVPILKYLKHHYRRYTEDFE